MFRLLIAALALSAAVAGPARAQAFDDEALAAVDACLAMTDGAPIGPAAARLGFTPSALAPDRYVKAIGARQLQIRLTREPTTRGRTMRTCGVGVWGGLDDEARATRILTTRARTEGYRVPAAAAPALHGGVEIMMRRGTGDAERGIQVSVNPAIDPARGAGTVVVYGWTE
jgi:hypothetical protein